MKQHWAQALVEIPGIRRVIGVTSPRAYRQRSRKELREDDLLDRYIRNHYVRGKAEGLYWYDVGDRLEIDKFIDKIDNEDIAESLRGLVDFIEDIKDLPNRASWSSMFNQSPEAKAKDFIDIYKSIAKDERPGLMRELALLDDAGYTSDRFYEEYDRLMAEYFREQRAVGEE